MTRPGLILENVMSILENNERKYKKRFLVNAGTGIRSVEVSQAAWFISTGKATFLCTTGSVWYPVEFSLDNLENILDPDRFFRINRQYIVSFNAIGKMHILSKSRIKLEINPSPDEDIYVSTARARIFREWLDR